MATQLELPTWGDRRPGAGRKAKPGARQRVSHKKRPDHASRFPIHAVWRTREDAPRLRRATVVEAIRDALTAGGRRAQFRIVH